MNWKQKFAKETERNGVQMRLIGGWTDLCAYYLGTDGNAWSCHMAPMGWSNNGPIAKFREWMTAGKYRGELFNLCHSCHKPIEANATACPNCLAIDTEP